MTQEVFASATIPAGDSSSFSYNVDGAHKLNIFASYSWAETDATTSGIRIVQSYGYAIPDASPPVTEAENQDDVPDLPQPTLGASTTEGHVWEWAVPVEFLPDYLIYTVYNDDATNDMTITLTAVK